MGMRWGMEVRRAVQSARAALIFILSLPVECISRLMAKKYLPRSL
jgi:hypothetical protein